MLQSPGTTSSSLCLTVGGEGNPLVRQTPNCARTPRSFSSRRGEKTSSFRKQVAWYNLGQGPLRRYGVSIPGRTRTDERAERDACRPISVLSFSRSLTKSPCSVHFNSQSTPVVPRCDPRHRHDLCLPHLLAHLDEDLRTLLVQPVLGLDVSHRDVLLERRRRKTRSNDSDLSLSVRREDLGSLYESSARYNEGGRANAPRAGGPFSTFSPILLRDVPPFLSSANVRSAPMNASDVLLSFPTSHPNPASPIPTDSSKSCP